MATVGFCLLLLLIGQNFWIQLNLPFFFQKENHHYTFISALVIPLFFPDIRLFVLENCSAFSTEMRTGCIDVLIIAVGWQNARIPPAATVQCRDEPSLNTVSSSKACSEWSAPAGETSSCCAGSGCSCKGLTAQGWLKLVVWGTGEPQGKALESSCLKWEKEIPTAPGSERPHTAFIRFQALTLGFWPNSRSGN